MFFKKVFSLIRKDYLKFIKHHHTLVIIVFLLITAFFGYRLTHLSLKSDFIDLFPENNPNVQTLKKITETYGAEGYLIAVLEWNSTFKDALSWLNTLIRETEAVRKDLYEALSRNDPEWLAEWLREREGKIKIQALLDFYSTIKKNMADEVVKNPNEKYHNLLHQELEIILNDSTSRWLKFSQDLKNFDNGFAFLYCLDDNIFGFNKYLQAIKQNKGGKRPLLKFAEEFSALAGKEKNLIRYAEYKFKTSLIKNNLLYFINLEDLQEIKNRLRKKITYERRKKVISSPLLEDSPVLLSFEDIQEKYEQGPKIYKVTKQTSILEKSISKYDYYINQKEDLLLILLKPTQDSKNLAFNQTLINRMQEIAQNLQKKYPKELSFGFTGKHVKKLEDSRIIRNDLKLVLSCSVLLILIFIYFIFKNLRSILSISLTLGGGLIWTAGIMELTLGFVNVLTGVSIAILSGLGVIYAFNMLSRYLEERKRGRNSFQALEIVFDTTFVSNLTTAVTIAAAFLLLTLSSFKGFSQFGYIVGIGILILLIVGLFVFPSVLILSEKIKPLKIRKDTAKIDSQRGKRFPFYRGILIISLLLTLFSIFGLFKIKFNANFYDLAFQNTPGRHYEKKAETLINMSLWPIIIYTKDWDTMLNISDKIITMKEQGDLPTFYKIDSIANYLPEDQAQKQLVFKEIKAELNDISLTKIKNPEDLKKIERLKELTDSPMITPKDIPEEILRQFTGSIPGYFIFCYPKQSLPMSSSRMLLEINADIQKILAQADASRIMIGSEASIFQDIIKNMKREAPLIFILLLAAIFLILLLDLRSIRPVLISLSPIFTGLIWVFGLSFLFKIQLNFFSMMMLPIIIGIGINYGVHFLHRYKEEGIDHILFIFKTTGHSILIGALINSIGFGMLLFSYYKGLAQMGAIALLGILSTALSSAFLLPALLELKKELKEKGLKSLFLRRTNSK